MGQRQAAHGRLLVAADASGPGLSSAEPPTYARRAQGQPPQADTSSSQNGSSALGSLFERYKLLATTFVVAVIALGVLFAAAPTQTAVGARVAIYGGRLSDDVSVWLQEPAHQIRGVEPAVIEEWSRALRALGVRHILVVDWADDRRQTATTLMVDLKGVDAESIAEETKDRIGAAATVTFDERKLIVDFLNPN